MLSAESRPYIDASVPVLREHGLAITQAFYANLFAEYPELSQLFNLGNQANGSQQQALASAVFAYAANIDNTAALEPVVSRIVHKHVSVGIRAEHYPIVGRHLLGAIQQVLGAAATPELLAAWDEAYGLLAQALIDAEQALYAERGISPGEMRTLTVSEIRRESALVSSYRLVPIDGEPIWAFKPGQYVTVRAELPEGRQQLRQYSLSDANDGQSIRISIKREPAGKAQPAGQVSNWLHERLAVGSRLQAGPPSGDFTPDLTGHAPLVLLSAGIGITPMIAVLNQLALSDPGRTVIFGYAARDPEHAPHRQDLAHARARMPELKICTFYEQAPVEIDADDQLGQMQISRLPIWPYADSKVYLCGPIGFMRAQWQDLLAAGVPAARLHREVFGPELLDHLL